MKKLANKFFWRFLTTLLFVLIVYVIYSWTVNEWTIDQITNFIIEATKVLIPSLILLLIAYKMFFEKIILNMQRKKSAEVIATKINKIVQKSGAVRSGKDSSTVGAATIVAEYFLRQEKKDLKKWTYDLYIYDFQKVNNWIDLHYKNFFVVSEMRLTKAFENMIKENNCFINEYWLSHGVVPKEHFRSWKYKKNKYVPDIAFNDGLVVGGKHFLDLLKDYTITYVYHYYIPNFIMSNQPILEKATINKKTGKIKTLFSKQLSQDFFKLKEDTPIPFPLRGFVIETETGMLYSNTDSAQEKEIKQNTGMREFYTACGHILRERLFLYGITQSATRVMKVLRELYPSYQHVFKMKFKATSDTRRLLLRIRIFLKKIKLAFLKLFRFLNQKSFSLFRYKLHKLIKPNKQIAREKKYTRKINKTTKKISKLSQRELQLWSKGYIQFYTGVYENISDVGRKVNFPVFSVIRESTSEATTYQTFGFKQVNKIKDSFGKYDTHFIYSVREAKEILQEMHFDQVPNWIDFKVRFDDIKFMNYPPFLDMFSVRINYNERIEKEKKIIENKRKQRLKNIELPNFKNLSLKELLDLCSDHDIEISSLDKSSKTFQTDIIKKLSDQFELYKKIL